MLPVTNSVIVLCGKTPGPSDNNAKKIAEFLGAETTIVSVAQAHDIESIRQIVPPCVALIVHIDTLVGLVDALDLGVNGLLTLVDLSAHVFVYGYESKESYASILKILSLGGLAGLKPLLGTDLLFGVSDGHRRWCGQFSGLSFHAVDRTRDACFVEGESHAEQTTVLVRAAGQPFFVRVGHGRSDVFFAACNELGNLDEKIPDEPALLPWFSRLIPLMIFLRSALGHRLWHSDHSQACFIIDDPLLKQRYGFLEFSRLLDAMSEQTFCASIAFIPWNYRRSRKQIVNLFSTAPASLSLCVHGYDHTKGEFAATTYGLLRDKARLALDRMQVHREVYRLPFDDVMVFPQGLFSSEALKALDTCGYLAAVNTTLCPSNMPLPLTLGDLLDVAVTKFGGVPLFARHYPKEIAEFAFDLFLGKPALVVEHHGYFRNGYGELARFVKRLNEINERLEWHNLAAICSRACLKKVAPSGDIHVRFFCNRFQLTNRGTRSETYVLLRPWREQVALPTVALNGRSWPGDLKDGTFTTSLALEPGETADLRISSEPTSDTNAPAWKPTNAHKTRVLVRRFLSEFRDDHLETNPLLSKLLSHTRKLRTKNKRAQSSLSGCTN